MSWDWDCPNCRACGCGPTKPEKTCSYCGSVVLITPPELGGAFVAMNQELASKALTLRDRLSSEWANQLGLERAAFDAAYYVEFRTYKLRDGVPRVLCSVRTKGEAGRV